MRQHLLVVLVIALGAVAGIAVFQLGRQASESEEALRERGALVFPEPIVLAPFELVDHAGARFTNEQLEGRWTLAFFGYTYCPDVCPTTMAVLAEAREALARSGLEPRLLLVSVDPVRDSPARLAEYVGGFSREFVGVTGTPDALAAFAAQLHVGFTKMPDMHGDDYLVAHGNSIALLNPAGAYHAILKAPHDAENIAAMVSAIARAN
ncbi:MAG: SCO family protein [Gammaproteobacteria bacterium]|jgi:protein SCO1/2